MYYGYLLQETVTYVQRLDSIHGVETFLMHSIVPYTFSTSTLSYDLSTVDTDSDARAAKRQKVEHKTSWSQRKFSINPSCSYREECGLENERRNNVPSAFQRGPERREGCRRQHHQYRHRSHRWSACFLEVRMTDPERKFSLLILFSYNIQPCSLRYPSCSRVHTLVSSSFLCSLPLRPPTKLIDWLFCCTCVKNFVD